MCMAGKAIQEDRLASKNGSLMYKALGKIVINKLLQYIGHFAIKIEFSENAYCSIKPRRSPFEITGVVN